MGGTPQGAFWAASPAVQRPLLPRCAGGLMPRPAPPSTRKLRADESYDFDPRPRQDTPDNTAATWTRRPALDGSADRPSL
jgi:hypothetical protein